MTDQDTGTIKPGNRFSELESTCFVIMPFGVKKVGEREVDFNVLYTDLFEPAINEVVTPEKQRVKAVRTDMDAFSGSINQEMFEYIVYSRLAFADISGLNPNVFYELGARHSLQESGTVLFRQEGHVVPFDIASIKVFEYAAASEKQLKSSRKLISDVISETLQKNRLDSPVRIALRAQWGGGPEKVANTEKTEDNGLISNSFQESISDEKRSDWRKQVVEDYMRDGEEAIRINDLDAARTNFNGALRFSPLNIIARMKLGLVYKRLGQYYNALQEFSMITKVCQNYGEAWREKGVVEGMIARAIPEETRARMKWMPDGYDSLSKATLLIPHDFDVWSSLGGVLKNVRKEYSSALKMYQHATDLSNGHPYPLLNAMKLEARETGKLHIKKKKVILQQARALRIAQALSSPPVDTPWCYFDIAEINLYLGDHEGCIEYLTIALENGANGDQLATFKKSLQETLVDRKIQVQGLEEVMDVLSEKIDNFSH